MPVSYAHLVLGLTLAVSTAHAEAPVRLWQLNRRRVAVTSPTWCVSPAAGTDGAESGPNIDFFLAANPQSIDASLREAGWQQQYAKAAVPNSATIRQVPRSPSRVQNALQPPPDVVYTRPDSRGIAQEALLLWQTPERDGPHDPLPAWQASLVPLPLALDASSEPQRPTAMICRDPLAELVATLLDGEARVLTATSTGQASRPFLELRHAAAEMRNMLHASARLFNSFAGANLMCPSELLLPLPTPPAMPLAQTVFWHDALTQKRVAITFDACSTFGHGNYNPAVIAVLQAMQVPATLFVGGHWAEMHPKELQALATNPLFEIGNHTYSHPHMRDLSVEAQKQELLWTQDAIFSRTGVLPRFFRPPYGEVDDQLIASAAAAGLITVEYDLPAGDADFHVSDTRLIDWVVGKTTPGSIVIMHMNHPGNKTAEVLPDIIRQLRRRGLILSSIGGMLAEQHH